MIKIVLLDEGLEEMANQFKSLITKGQWGTGTATPTTTQTCLGSALPTTLLTVDNAQSGNTVQFTHTVPSTVANSEDLTEYELQFANGDSLNRSVNGAISKTQNFEIVTITGVTFIRST